MTSVSLFSPEEVVARVLADGRLERLIDKSGGATACWPWIGKRKPRGYGIAKVGRRSYSAHRLSFACWVVGPSLLSRPHECVLHGCDNPPCCNPAHLRIGTCHDNIRDAMERGRWRSPKVGGRGRRVGAKLSESDVRMIRENGEGLTQRAWAARLGVSKGAIYSVVSGRKWKSVLPLHGVAPCVS